MPTRTLGVDLAGDKSSPTGIVELTLAKGALEVTDATILKGHRAQLFERCATFEGDIAVDQPFGYSRHHEALLAGGNVDPTLDADHIRFRAVDRTARQQLAEAGLKRDYVLAATSCDNLWRALLLLQAAGVDLHQARRGEARIVETHPRIALFHLLEGHPERTELIRTYKSSKAKATAHDVRRSLVDEWLQAGWLRCADTVVLATLSQTDDGFEGLIAAIAAAAKSLEIATRLGDPDEGVYVLPPSLARLRKYLDQTA